MSSRLIPILSFDPSNFDFGNAPLMIPPMPIKLVGGPVGYNGVDVTKLVADPRNPNNKFLYFKRTADVNVQAYEFSIGDGNYHYREIRSLQAAGKPNLKSHDIG